MKKRIIAILLIVALPVIFYFSGPKFDNPVFSNNLPVLAVDSLNVENFVQQMEATYKIRPDNEARIIWNNDTLKSKTEFCVLYLHGFGACWYEGYPVNVNLAKHLQANAFFARLAAHGLETPDPLLDMRPADLYATAKEALVIARALGQKVIVVGTSTGGTLALKLAVDFPEMVHSLILLSPNIAINNPKAFLLSGHWGLQIARKVGGTGNFRVLKPGTPNEDKYWYQKYRWEGTVFLQQLIDATMDEELFAQVKQPVFLGYYYKNEEEQDQTVRVDAMLEMYDRLGTPDELKYKVAFPDANNHVIGCEDISKSSREVELAVVDFAKKILQ